jgi:uncharacterized protein involved in exopolysaccharide biosynthesis
VQSASERTHQRLAALLHDKASKESTLERLTQEYQLARDNYGTLNRRYQDTSINVSARSTDLKVVAPAVVPERPVKPQIPLNVLLAFALGLMVSSLMTLLQHHWKLVRMHSATEAVTEEKIKEIKRSAKGFS